jgi:glycosyltransferase involved in cell wall biosynthesis
MSHSSYFSVLMPLFNHEKFVGAAVQSVLQQSFGDYELVICDDGSTDNSFAVVSGFSDPRIKIIKRENGGTTSALNSCLLASSGRYICWLSSDDLFAPSKLETHFEYHRRQAAANISIAPYAWISGQEVVPRAQKTPHQAMRLLEFIDGSYINGLSVCVERSEYVRLGGFNQCYRYAQDTEQWFRILRKAVPAFLDGDPQSFSRKGTSTLPGSSLLGHLDSFRIFLKALVFDGFDGFIPAGEDELLIESAALDRLIEICVSPSNYFSRFGLRHVFWSALKGYALNRPDFSAAFESRLFSKRSGGNDLGSEFPDWWLSGNVTAVDSRDVLKLYLRVFDSLGDPKVRDMFNTYLAKIV